MELTTTNTTATKCGSGGTANGAHGAVFFDLRRAHRVQYDEKKDVQREAVASEQISTSPVRQDYASEREHDPLWKGHALVSTGGFTTSECSKW